MATSNRKGATSWVLQTASSMARPFVQPLVGLVRPVAAFAMDQTVNMLKLAAIAVAFTAVMVVCAGCTSLVYVLLHWLLIPKMVFDSQIYFDYDPGSTGQLPASLAATALTSANPQHALRTITKLPVAKFRLSSSDQQWDVYVPDDNVPGRVNLQPAGYDMSILTAGQQYDVWVELVVPITKQNENVGVFMVNTTLINLHNQPIATSKRPGIVHVEDYNVFLTPIYPWLYLLGYFESTQKTIRVDSFERFVEGYGETGTTFAEVTLSNQYLQVFSARLCFLCKLTGIRYFVYHWQWTSYIIFMMATMSVESIAVLVVFVYGISILVPGETMQTLHTAHEPVYQTPTTLGHRFEESDADSHSEGATTPSDGTPLTSNSTLFSPSRSSRSATSASQDSGSASEHSQSSAVASSSFTPASSFRDTFSEFKSSAGSTSSNRSEGHSSDHNDDSSEFDYSSNESGDGGEDFSDIGSGNGTPMNSPSYFHLTSNVLRNRRSDGPAP